MNIIFLLIFIASSRTYTFNKVSVPFNNLSSSFNGCNSLSANCFDSAKKYSTSGKNKFEFGLFAKNPCFERKQREQRRSRRLKQVMPSEEMRTNKQVENLKRKIEFRQKKLFGYRLSELPGDGGIIPFLESSGDKSSCVRNYFASYEGRDEEYVKNFMNDEQMVTSISVEPSKTIGKFKDDEPLAKKVFYNAFEGIFTQEAFVQATFKKTISSIRRRNLELFEGTQNYYGLQVETLFSHLDPEDMDYLRQIEIQVKKGKIDVNFLSPKGEGQLGSGGTTENSIGNTASDNNDFDEV